MKKLMVFDLDGTLNKTENYAVPAITDALRDFGYTNFSEKEIIPTIGARDKDTIDYFFGKDAPKYENIFWKKVYEYIESKYSTSYQSYSGTEQMLQKLKENKWILAICSNADKDYIKKTLNRLGISEYFDYIQPLVEFKTKRDTLRILLDKVKADQAIMVGDRFYDKDAAFANNIKFAACLYGYGTVKELEGSNYFLHSPSDVLNIKLSL